MKGPNSHFSKLLGMTPRGVSPLRTPRSPFAPVWPTVGSAKTDPVAAADTLPRRRGIPQASLAQTEAEATTVGQQLTPAQISETVSAPPPVPAHSPHRISEASRPTLAPTAEIQEEIAPPVEASKSHPPQMLEESLNRMADVFRRETGKWERPPADPRHIGQSLPAPPAPAPAPVPNRPASSQLPVVYTPAPEVREAQQQPIQQETEPTIEIGRIDIRMMPPPPRPAMRSSRSGPLTRPTSVFGLRQS